MMAALLDDIRPAVPSATGWLRRMSASVSAAPKAPILRKLRRLRPSQKRCLAPQSVSMLPPLRKTPIGPWKTALIVTGKGDVRNAQLVFFRPARLLGEPGAATPSGAPPKGATPPPPPLVKHTRQPPTIASPPPAPPCPM